MKAEFFNGVVNYCFTCFFKSRFFREKYHAYAISAGLGKAYLQVRAFLHKKFMRNLYQYTRSVAAFRVAATGAAVFHMLKHRKCVVNYFVTCMPVFVGYKARTARVVFYFRPVKPLVRFSLIHR